MLGYHRLSFTSNIHIYCPPCYLHHLPFDRLSSLKPFRLIPRRRQQLLHALGITFFTFWLFYALARQVSFPPFLKDNVIIRPIYTSLNIPLTVLTLKLILNPEAPVSMKQSKPPQQTRRILQFLPLAFSLAASFIAVYALTSRSAKIAARLKARGKT